MTIPTSFDNGASLTDEQVRGHYVLVEHVLGPAAQTLYRHHEVDQMRSFLVIDGAVTLEAVEPDRQVTDTRVERLDGWHAPPESAFRVRADHGAVLIEAGVGAAEVTSTAQRPRVSSGCSPVSRYTVAKPWGHEVWYTENLIDPGYALKQIHMAAGHQSSLQSHQYKVETNYVVDGEATVLNGLAAPDDPSTVIDVDLIPVQRHPARTGWSSSSGILHRVIAHTDYTSVEVSTPELDDVVRWQDDSGRGNGRIGREHQAARR